jgi:pentatricopeptide repeat protein
MVVPPGVAYNAAISRCSRAGLHQRALALLHEMRDRGHHADEYTLPPILNSAALLRVPAGAVVVRQGDDRETAEVWLAPQYSYIPVRMLVVDKDGTRLEQIPTRISQ